MAEPLVAAELILKRMTGWGNDSPPKWDTPESRYGLIWYGMIHLPSRAVGVAVTACGGGQQDGGSRGAAE